jgi:hypothetical protein
LADPHALHVPATHTWAAPHCAEVVHAHGPASHAVPQHVSPLLQARPALPASPHATQAPATHVSSAAGQSAAVAHSQRSFVHALPFAHGEQPGVPGAHAMPSAPHAHAPASHEVPAAQLVKHAPQFSSSVASSAQPTPQHVVPSPQALPIARKSQATQRPARHTSPGPLHSSGLVHVQYGAFGGSGVQLSPTAHAEQPGVPGGQLSALAPQTHAPSTHGWLAAHDVPQPPQLPSSPTMSVHVGPQQARPAPQMSEGALGSSHVTHRPATQSSSAEGQSTSR